MANRRKDPHQIYLYMRNEKVSESRRNAKASSVSQQAISSDKHSVQNGQRSNNTGVSLIREIADNVTAIVGLREAIVWKQDWLRVIWIASLITGLGATVWFVTAAGLEYLSTPTATRIELEQLPTYKYPAIVLCPDEWLDVDRALSLGLSMDGLKYSLGYMFTTEDDLNLDNLTTARQNFLKVYYEKGFSSLDDYYKAVAVEVYITDQHEDFVRTKASMAFCSACEGKAQKIVFEAYVCYSFQLKDQMGSRRSLGRQVIAVKMEDKTEGILQITRRWQLYVSSNPERDFKITRESYVGILKFTWTILRITVHCFRKMKLRNRNCLEKEEMEAMYPGSSPDICYTRCMGNSTLENMLRCAVYTTSVADASFFPPELYCNFFEFPSVSHYSKRVAMIDLVREVINPSKVDKCNSNCPYECERTTYEVRVQAQIEEVDMGLPMLAVIKTVRSQNTSVFGLRIEHGATYEGGILTLTEVDTISFTSLVGNFGGALGLFVGATMMTFVQMILFPIKYLLDRRETNRKKSDTRAGERAEKSDPEGHPQYGGCQLFYMQTSGTPVRKYN